MAGHDRQHFEDYRKQTQVKHEILAAYLPVYFHILKKWEKNLLFVDGFAGRGTYTEAKTGAQFDGSPLRALKMIASNNDLSKKAGTIFIESDEVLFRHLKAVVDEFYKNNPEIRQPICLQGTFSDRIAEVLKSVKGQLAPTFLFVDPCGVDGASFKTIQQVMECEKCEAFIFFNIDGVRRIAGLEGVSDVLIDLMGSESRAESLYHALRKTEDVGERERLIVTNYCDAIKEEMRAQYIVKFRVEHEQRRKTSHYLIHATKHSLGFRIMKDVMWRRGHADEQPGGLELSQSSRTDFVSLFDFRSEVIKDEILTALLNGPMQISLFYEEWPARPDDMLCEAAYRKELFELEAENKIEVLSKDRSRVVGLNDRKKYKGKPTLGKDYFVQLKMT